MDIGEEGLGVEGDWGRSKGNGLVSLVEELVLASLNSAVGSSQSGANLRLHGVTKISVGLRDERELVRLHWRVAIKSGGVPWRQAESKLFNKSCNAGCGNGASQVLISAVASLLIVLEEARQKVIVVGGSGVNTITAVVALTVERV